MANEKKNVLNKEGLLYVWQKIKALLDKKVDKVDGKQLSTNDLTDELKEMILKSGTSDFDGAYTSLTSKPSINSIELVGNKTSDDLGLQAKGDYANKVHTHTASQVTGGKANCVAGFDSIGNLKSLSQVPVAMLETAFAGYDAAYGIQEQLDNKSNVVHSHTKSDITDFPTKLSQFTNDSEFQTAAQVSSSITAAIGKINSFDIKVVTQLPSSGVKGTIYLTPTKSASTNQAYDEYIWVENKWEFVGTTAADLTGYLKTTDLVEITNAEIDNIFASI